MRTNCSPLSLEGMLLGTKFQPLLSLKYKYLILHLLKYLPCVYIVSVCLQSTFTGHFDGFCIGTNLGGHSSSTCLRRQGHLRNVPDVGSPAFRCSEAGCSLSCMVRFSYGSPSILGSCFSRDTQISFSVTSAH